MPVVSTMVLMSLQRRRGDDFPQPFTAPRELRRRLQRSLGEAPDTLAQALAIATEIEMLLEAHQSKSEEIMTKYVDNMHTRYRNAEELSRLLAPIDEARLSTLFGIIERREQLRSLLTAAQWQAAFVD